VVKRGYYWNLALIVLIPALAGCSNVSERAAERRPFFQPEYQTETHGRKTLFDRIVELDPGRLHMNVAPDYQRNAPLKVAVLPFADRGSANFVVDKIPLTFRDRQQRAIWAWTDAQRLRRGMIGYLSEREFEVINPIGIDAVLHAHGIDDETKLTSVDPRKLGAWLGADAVVYGEVLHYEAYYFALVSGWQVGVQGRMVSTHDDEQLLSFDGSRYDVDFMPAFDPTDIMINSAESLLELRDIQLSRSEEEVCRELVKRIPVSENLRLQIAQEALETSNREDEASSANESNLSRSSVDPPAAGNSMHEQHSTTAVAKSRGI
jgi:Putative bacterial lipoprotein (DUF799)